MTTARTSDGGLSEAIEHVLDSGDISNLVRLVFATDPTRSLPVPLGADGETTSLGDEFFGNSAMEEALEALQEVSEDREEEIRDICRYQLEALWRGGIHMSILAQPVCGAGMPKCQPHSWL